MLKLRLVEGWRVFCSFWWGFSCFKFGKCEIWIVLFVSENYHQNYNHNSVHCQQITKQPRLKKTHEQKYNKLVSKNCHKISSSWIISYYYYYFSLHFNILAMFRAISNEIQRIFASFQRFLASKLVFQRQHVHYNSAFGCDFSKKNAILKISILIFKMNKIRSIRISRNKDQKLKTLVLFINFFGSRLSFGVWTKTDVCTKNKYEKTALQIC